MLEKITLPRIGSIRVRAISRRDIQSLHHGLKSTPYRANRVLALLSKMFSLATEWGWPSDNPANGIPRYHEDKRETWLTGEQVEDLLAAMETSEERLKH